MPISLKLKRLRHGFSLVPSKAVRHPSYPPPGTSYLRSNIGDYGNSSQPILVVTKHETEEFLFYGH